jgi:quercetin dioxygenase-like cupin family protein
MSGIRIHDARDNKWMEGREFGSQQSGMGMSSSQLSRFSDDSLSAPVRMHEPGDEKTLQLFETRLPPDMFVDVHSHASDEIIYVLNGSLELGKRSLGPGSSVFIGADTLYSFRSGPDGLHFLNFRPHKDTVHRNREQHLAYLKQKGKGSEGRAE